MVVVFHRKDKLTFTTQAIDSCCLTCIDVGVEVYFRDLQHRLSPVDLSFTMVSNEIDYVGRPPKTFGGGNNRWGPRRICMYVLDMPTPWDEV